MKRKYLILRFEGGDEDYFGRENLNKKYEYDNRRDWRNWEDS